MGIWNRQYMDPKQMLRGKADMRNTGLSATGKASGRLWVEFKEPPRKKKKKERAK